ncbi:MAG: hypothetical protein ACREJQ_01080, partial [bacterium]
MSKAIIIIVTTAMLETCTVREKTGAETRIWSPPPVIYMHSRPLEGPIPEDLDKITAKTLKDGRYPRD